VSSQLTDEDRARLQRHREWLLGHYEVDPKGSYSGWNAKLVLVDTILTSGWVRSDETWKLHSLGVALGDALMERMGLQWVIIEDEYGRDVALQDGDTSLRLFPLTMISKRVEKGESVDVTDLFNKVCAGTDEYRRRLRNG
jgi:hypothetical protein